MISSTKLSIEFDPGTGGIRSIADALHPYEFMRGRAERPLLWRLAFRGKDDAEVMVDNTSAPPPTFDRKAHSLAIRWDGVGLSGEGGVLDVHADFDLGADDDTTLLRLSVHNRSNSFGLWNVEFPVIATLSEPGAADLAVSRGRWGQLYRGAYEKVTGEYPSYTLPMQFMLLNEGDHGLYLAAHDPRSMTKLFSLEPGGEFCVGTWPENMGVPGAGWSAPYPFAIGVYRGDWMTGCKRYRTWALSEAPWTAKGPLSKRPDVPESIKRVCAWIVAQGPPERVVPAAREFAQAIGVPVGLHWYDWHEVPLDISYKPIPGFTEAVADLRRDGIVVMPYVNARIWYTGRRPFQESETPDESAKDEHKHVVSETYDPITKQAVMCPTQAAWQERVLEIVRHLVDTCGVNAVYLDQIASAAPRRCFDPDHGHPLGSGSWWVDGYRNMLAPIKEFCASQGREVGLTSENNAEPYMDNIDGLLIWTPRDGTEIPVTTAVYGGYTLCFASNHVFAYGDESFCVCQARDFVWGTQLGWDWEGLYFDTETLSPKWTHTPILQPEHAAKLEYQSRLARTRALAADYLVYGELIEVLRPENPVPHITATLEGWTGTYPADLDAVQGTLWRGSDGSAAAILANADSEPHQFAFTFDAGRHQMGPTGRWDISQVGRAGKVDLTARIGTTFQCAVEVPTRDAAIVILRPAR